MLLHRVHLENELVKLNISGFDSHMRGSVYKEILFSLSDSFVRFALDVGVDCIVAETRYSSVLANRVVPRSSEISWNQLDCPG